MGGGGAALSRVGKRKKMLVVCAGSENKKGSSQREETTSGRLTGRGIPTQAKFTNRAFSKKNARSENFKALILGPQ